MTINYIGAFLLIVIGLAIIVLKKNLNKNSYWNGNFRFRNKFIVNFNWI